MRHTRIRGVAAALLALAAGARAQDGEEPPLPPLPEDVLQPGASQQGELLELFQRVRETLRSVDVLLAEAGAGEAPLERLRKSGLEDLLPPPDGAQGVGALLAGSKSGGERVVRDIDRILEVVRQSGAGTSRGAMSPPSGASPLDEPRDGGPTGREETPTEPEEAQPDEGGEEPQVGADPESPEESRDPGENRPATPDAHERGDPVPVDPEAERWGELPPRYREVFRRTGSDDMPVQYRDWIDAYYRRLSRER